MVTFNVDSLDFVDDEEARFGTDADFATRFDSANSRLELEDLNAGTVGYIPQDISTDLVGGKFAETVAEGKALADDGNVYDTIQEAENNASSWVKVGPGNFRESVTVTTTGLTIQGSGERTEVNGGGDDAIRVDSTSDITIKDIKLVTPKNTSITMSCDEQSNNVSAINVTIVGGNGALQIRGDNGVVKNCLIRDSSNHGIRTSTNSKVIGTTIRNVDGDGWLVYAGDDGDNSIVANCVIENVGDNGIRHFTDDGIIIGNVVRNAGDYGIDVGGADIIVANNRLIGNSSGGIFDLGSGNVTDANLVT